MQRRDAPAASASRVLSRKRKRDDKMRESRRLERGEAPRASTECNFAAAARQRATRPSIHSLSSSPLPVLAVSCNAAAATCFFCFF